VSARLTLLGRPGSAVAVATGGSVLLVARPLMLARTDRPIEALVILFTGLLIVGVCWPARAHAGPERARPGWDAAPILAVGVAAFTMGRVLGGGDSPTSALGAVIALNTLAAVAEEAFFRRLVYETFLSRGPVVAVLASTTLFAIVHVTVYGLWVLPLDLAAGLVLSWQRWATGSWHVPALWDRRPGRGGGGDHRGPGPRAVVRPRPAPPPAPPERVTFPPGEPSQFLPMWSAGTLPRRPAW